jgi:hypothetical protein
MKGFFIFILLLSFDSYSQDYSKYSLSGGNGTYEFSKAWVDDDNFKVIAFKFIPHTFILVLINQQNEEIARYSVEVSKISFNGFTSTDNEFIIYFDGIINGKRGEYFLAFFKNQDRQPILSEWITKPTEGEKLFSYSYKNKMYYISSLRNSNQFRIYEVSNVDQIVSIGLIYSSQEFIDILKSASISSIDGNFGSSAQVKLYPLINGFIVINPNDKLAKSKEFSVTLTRVDFLKLQISSISIQTNYKRQMTALLMNRHVVIYNISSFPDPVKINLEFWDYQSSILEKKIEVNYSPQTSIKNGLLIDKKGGSKEEKWDKINAHYNLLTFFSESGIPWIGVNQNLMNDFNLRLGISNASGGTPSYIQGPNGVMMSAPTKNGTYTTYHFPACLNSSFEKCDHIRNDPYHEALIKYHDIQEKRRFGELNFEESDKIILCYFYDDKNNQYSVASLIK